MKSLNTPIKNDKLNPMKILIIEDDPLMNKMYSEKLSRDGFEVAAASHGREGLEKLKAEPPDLVILDIMMPGISGLQVIDEMKRDPRLEKIPIIVLSNLSGNPDIEKAKKRGIQEYLIKSDLDPEDVSRTVKKYLK